MVIKFKKPVSLNGSELSELNLALDSLKGSDLIELETAFRQLYRGEYIPVANLDVRYQILVAGRVSGTNPEDLGNLFAPDFVEVCSTVQNFLLGTGLEDRKKIP